MRIIVLLRQVPDLVEDLVIADDGTSLDAASISHITSEWDEYALEEALQLRDEVGGTVTCLVPGGGGAPEVMATCLARGADRAIAVGSFAQPPSSRSAAALFAAALATIGFDLVLTGVQAVDDLGGQLCPFLAARLDLPHVSAVNAVAAMPNGNTVVVDQENTGGVAAELEVDLPAVLGLSASRVPPRYAAVSRVRQILRSVQFETLDAAGDDDGLIVESMSAAPTVARAVLIEGDAERVADRLVAILAERGLTPGKR
jgi:electron transfer flavoprotein beta subunit